MPLSFWLPRTYGRAAPPVAVWFAIMTKWHLCHTRLSSLLSATHRAKLPALQMKRCFTRV